MWSPPLIGPAFEPANIRAVRMMNVAVLALLTAGIVPSLLEPLCISDINSWQRKFLHMHVSWYVGLVGYF